MLSSTRRQFLEKRHAAAATSPVDVQEFIALGLRLYRRAGVDDGAGPKILNGSRRPPWRAPAISSSGSIQVDPSARLQKILGFGAALTDSSCYLFEKLRAQQRKALLSELFGPAGLRLSMARTCIGASDYSTTAYSFDDSPEPDPELKRFQHLSMTAIHSAYPARSP